MFVRITKLLTWIWVGGVRRHDGVIGDPADRAGRRHDSRHQDPAVVRLLLGHPVRPAGLAALASRVLPERMAPPPEDIVRKTTFVAFAEAEIDQLIYLATEHANREVGAGKEAYDIRIGSKGFRWWATRPGSRGRRLQGPRAQALT